MLPILILNFSSNSRKNKNNSIIFDFVIENQTKISVVELKHQANFSLQLIPVDCKLFSVAESILNTLQFEGNQ